MKFLLQIALIALLSVVLIDGKGGQLFAQTAQTATAPETASIQGGATATSEAGSTVVTSDSFRLSMGEHQGIFTGNVVAVSKDFRMTARELTVFFAQGGGNKVERLIAKGDVEIHTDGRDAQSSQADYTLADDRLVLTGTPQITQNKDVITGTTITLYRRTNRLEVEGRSRVVLQQLGTPAQK